jgi:hypothetical protein
MQRRSSRSIRFARALIVASGLTGLGCGRGGTVDFPTTIADAGVLDAGAIADAGTRDAGIPDAGPFTCAQCDCEGVNPTLPSCGAINRAECCFAVGPLAPPELPTLT